ncbi:MAG: Mammalian cell entry related domain protein [Verrucomicrobiales bacterium]|nr:Mammalian cell entry related domain protein [Verrucomicrobiales bacterium]MDB6129564.1 Mammalian cell entry related domain protein [Verrucomicrobiales bacterium]
MKNTLETRIGIFFALAIVAFFIILEMLGGFNFFRPGYKLNASFKSAQELKKGDLVKMAGVQIGTVESVILTNDVVVVSFKVDDKNAPIKTDSKATIKFTGLMGQNYLAVDFGSKEASKAEAGAFITGAEQADLNQLMAKLDNVATGVENITKSFSGDQINNLLGPFTDFLKQNNAPLTAMIGNMKTVSDRIVEGKGTLGKLISDDALYNASLATVSNLQGTATDLKATMNDAKDVLNEAKKVVAEINSGRGTIGKLVKDESLYNETTAAMTNVRQIFEKINQGKGSVGQLINDDSFLKNAKMSLQKLDKATESLEDTGPLSVLGTAVNSLF